VRADFLGGLIAGLSTRENTAEDEPIGLCLRPRRGTGFPAVRVSA